MWKKTLSFIIFQGDRFPKPHGCRGAGVSGTEGAAQGGTAGTAKGAILTGTGKGFV